MKGKDTGAVTPRYSTSRTHSWLAEKRLYERLCALSEVPKCQWVGKPLFPARVDIIHVPVPGLRVRKALRLVFDD